MGLVKLRALTLDKKHTAVFVAYVFTLSVAIHFHEPWADEAQAWLLARDLSFSQLLFHWLRYEGTPGLWHVLLFVVQRFGMPYAALGWFAGCFATAGVYLFLRFAPFPFPIKAILPFSMFVLYQYAAVSRSYVLLPVLVFMAAYCIRQDPSRIYGLVVALSLLACVSAHGTIIAVGLAAAYAVTAFRRWKTFDVALRSQHWRSLVGFSFVLLSVVLLTLPTDDCSFLTGSGALMFNGQRILLILEKAFGLPLSLTIPFVLLLLFWGLCRDALLYFFFPGLVLVTFFSGIYYNSWHLGTLFLVAAAALWISWPGPIEKNSLTPLLKRTYQAVCISLFVLLGLHAWWGLRMVHYDVLYPYSGSVDAARELKMRNAGQRRTYAYGFSTVAVLPFFSNNIFVNQRTAAGTSFWRWSKSDPEPHNVTRIQSEKPELVIVATHDPYTEQFSNSRMCEMGYVPVHESQGALPWKGSTLQSETYVIFERANVNSAAVSAEHKP